MKIDVLYFEGCPNHEPAVDLTREVVAELSVDAEVSEIEVKTDEDAQRLRFLGSPSIRVDGVDIDPSARARTDYGFSCRMYGRGGLPPKEMLVAVLHQDESFGPNPAGLSSGQRTGLLASGGAVVAAVIASACCIGPFVLVALGVSAAGVSATFEPLRPYFLGATALLLGGGFYFAYFRKEKCAPGSACEVPNPRLTRFTRGALWVATIGVVVVALFPSYAGILFGEDGMLFGESTMAEVREASAELPRVTLNIDGMTCEACATSAQDALNALPGVHAASVDFDKAEAVVVLDAASPASTEMLTGAIKGAGFTATLKADEESDS